MAEGGRDKLELGEKYKVRLELPAASNMRAHYGSKYKVVFEVTPDLIENRNVNYKAYDPVHLPGAIYVYATTSSRIFNVSGVRLMSRTTEEASTNYDNILLLKAWTMPVFGIPFGTSGGGAGGAGGAAGATGGIGSPNAAGAPVTGLAGALDNAVGAVNGALGGAVSAVGNAVSGLGGAVGAAANAAIGSAAGAVSSAVSGAANQLASQLPSSARMVKNLDTIMNERIEANKKVEQTRMPFTTNNQSQEGLLGQPPPVLWFSAYHGGVGAATSGLGGGHLGRIPVVIQQLTIPYPSDVDYIPTSNGVPMPTIMTIDLTLLETHSPNEYSAFSLEQYRKGLLEHF